MRYFIKKLFPIFLSLLLFVNGETAMYNVQGTMYNKQQLKTENDNVQQTTTATTKDNDTGLPREQSSFAMTDFLNYSSVTDSYESGNEPIVVIIQDLHNDYAVQNNIYKTIEALTKNGKFDIYGEGVFDKTLNVSVLNDIPDNRIKKHTIKNLFENSQLSAYEYFALTKNKEIKGIENKNIYLENLKLYNEITENREINNFLANEVSAKIAYMKKYFIENRITAIQNLELAEIPLNEKEYPNLYKYKSVSQKISQINKNKLNRQFKNFIAKYKTYPKIYELLKLNSQYGYAKLYDYINENMPNEAKSNKELMLFLEKTKIITEINSVKLLYEKQMLENSLLTKENLEQTENEIFSLEKYCSYLKDLANMNILPEDYTKLKENKKYARELIKKYLPKNEAVFALTILNNEKFFTFYDNNFKRNKIFAAALTKDDTDKIIIAGGFHKGLTEELKKLNRSYIVLTPNISAFGAAFNKLFLNAFETGFNDDTINNISDIVFSWKIFFKNNAVFQREINSWIENSKILRDKNIKIIVLDNIISINYNGTVFEKTFFNTKNAKTKEKISVKQREKTVNDIQNTARQINLFGRNTRIKITSDDSLLENLIPVKFEQEYDRTNIYINKRFLDNLSRNPSLTIFFVRFVYFYYSSAANTDEMLQFMTNNNEHFREFYGIKQETEPSNFYKFKNGIKKAATKILRALSFKNRTISYELYDTELGGADEKNMNAALKQVSLARQTRNFLTTFIQPPIGAYISLETGADTDEEEQEQPSSTIVTGKNFNNTNSVLHAETLTFIDFLKNYINEFERLPTGGLTEKGEFLNNLLDLAVINGQDITNRIFERNPIIFANLGISLDYTKKRSIDTVFDESNAVLKFVNEQLGSPLSKVTLYCTLAPCNKCVKTMSVLGIERLVFGSYSANKSHKGTKILQDNGIRVTGGVLETACDEAIKNYRFMNASLFRTKIASAIQSVRRFYLFMVNRIDLKKVNTLISKISGYAPQSEIDIWEIQFTLETLRDNLNWNNLQENETLLDGLITLLKQIDVYDNPAKRAGIIYALKNGCTFKTENGNIYFYNTYGERLEFYINSFGKFAASQKYLNKMEILSRVRNFADLDDNLALRSQPFNDKIQEVFSILTLYGIANPIPITGNILDLAKKRLEPLGKQISSFIPSVYIENAAMQCNIENGEYVQNDYYMDYVAKSSIDEKTFNDLEEIFGDLSEQWYELFERFAKETKELRQRDNVTYKEFIRKLININTEVPDIIKDFIYPWGTFSRKEAVKQLDDIYRTAINKGLNKKEFLNVMKIMSLMEMARLYFSKDNADRKEASRLIKDFEKIDKGADLRGDFESPVRFVISPFRPNTVRAKVVQYFANIVRASHPDLEVVSSGQTTISVYKTGVNKSVPVRAEIAGGISADNIIFSGDEFNSGGVDYPLYVMQQENEDFNDMVVINTNHNVFDGNFISLINLEAFPQDNSVNGNIERSLLLQQIILDVLEYNIGRIAVSAEYAPKESIAQQVKNVIYMIEDIDAVELQKNLKDEHQLEKERENIVLVLTAA